MAICDLTKRDKAQRTQLKFNRLILGYKATEHKTWDDLAEACEESRQLLQYRFNHGCMDLWEWKILCQELHISSEEFMREFEL